MTAEDQLLRIVKMFGYQRVFEDTYHPDGRWYVEPPHIEGTPIPESIQVEDLILQALGVKR